MHLIALFAIHLQKRCHSGSVLTKWQIWDLRHSKRASIPLIAEQKEKILPAEISVMASAQPSCPL